MPALTTTPSPRNANAQPKGPDAPTPEAPLVAAAREMLDNLPARDRGKLKGFVESFYVQHKDEILKLSAEDKGRLGEIFEQRKMGHLFSQLMDQELKGAIKRGILSPEDAAATQVAAAHYGFTK